MHNELLYLLLCNFIFWFIKAYAMSKITFTQKTISVNTFIFNENHLYILLNIKKSLN